MNIFLLYLRQRRRGLLAFALFFVIFTVSFLLFRLPLNAVMYPTCLCVLSGAAMFFADFTGVSRKHRLITRLESLPAELTDDLPKPDSVESADYQTLIRLLCAEQLRAGTRMSERFEEATDYCTAWAHQIKTPIASMKLRLQNEDSPLSRQLSTELGRVERYVEMVMAFVRLDSESTDYIIREYALDGIIKKAVKKFAGEFIYRKLSLEYTQIRESALTDEKWLAFVIEQVLSNALKYTREGKVSIYIEPPLTLCVKDTGIGIAEENLPRIFERGYTGKNGRIEASSSGIGLYLCRRICKNLGHTISAESVVGEGTTVRIGLDSVKLEIE